MRYLCMCGATDCPSCGPAQGYRVESLARVLSLKDGVVTFIE